MMYMMMMNDDDIDDNNVSRFYFFGECVSSCPVGYFESTLLPSSTPSIAVSSQDFDVQTQNQSNRLNDSQQRLVACSQEHICDL